MARVRLGVADYQSNHVADAFAYLSALKVDDPEADAERLNYLIRCARKPDRHADVRQYLTELEQLHPTSKWRLDALVFLADQARTENDSGTFVPLYQACATSFPTDPSAAHCHWRLAFQSYRTDGADAYDLLRSHVRQYPKSEDINDALYFLGRLQERKNDTGAARVCYEELQRRYPNTYYALVARERLKTPDYAGGDAKPRDERVSRCGQLAGAARIPEFFAGRTCFEAYQQVTSLAGDGSERICGR